MLRLLRLSLATAVCTFAHSGLPLEPRDLPTRDAWRLDPLVVFGLLLSAWFYAAGTRRSGGLRRWERYSFWSGWMFLAVALASPLHPMGEVLFSAHMAQHEFIMVAAAPLLVLGRPMIPFLWALPMNARRAFGRWSRSHLIGKLWIFFTRPLNAFLIHFAVVWLWHIPSLFQRTLTSDLVHTAQHSTFLFSALTFWWALIHGRRARAGYGAGALYLFGTMLHTGLLGALLTFSPTLWYPAYADSAVPWGLTPLEDQQLAGLIMWVPPGVVYPIAALAMLTQWLEKWEHPALSAETQRPCLPEPPPTTVGP